HRFRSTRDDRKSVELLQAANDSDRIASVELGHHDVHEDHIDVRVVFQRFEAVFAVLRVEHHYPVLLQGSGQSEDISYVVVDNQHFSAGELRGGPVNGGQQLVALVRRQVADRLMQEQRRLLQNGFEGSCAFQDGDLRQFSEVLPLASAQGVRFIHHDRQFRRRFGLNDLLDEVYRAHIAKRRTEYDDFYMIFY